MRISVHSYAELVARRKREFGDKFSDKQLAPKFIKFYESGERIKVRTLGEELTGTVGVTTGWVPCFLLMRTSRSMGSSITLSEKDEIIGVKRGKKYV